MRSQIAALRCPTDDAPDNNTKIQIHSEPLGTANYIGATGSDTFEGNASQSLSLHGCFCQPNSNTRFGPQNKGVKFRDIKDGQSNTILLGERKWSFSDVNGAVLFSCSANSWGVPHNHSDTWRRGYQLGVGVYKMSLEGTDQAGQMASGNVSKRGSQGFSSDHPGGAQFCLADGSVRFIAETVDGHFDHRGVQTNAAGSAAEGDRRHVDTVWEALMAKADRKPVGDY